MCVLVTHVHDVLVSHCICNVTHVCLCMTRMHGDCMFMMHMQGKRTCIPMLVLKRGVAYQKHKLYHTFAPLHFRSRFAQAPAPLLLFLAARFFAYVFGA